jgi:outer membrane protein assembly factor BamA
LGAVGLAQDQGPAQDAEPKRLVNATHWTSRRQTVLNEVWFKPGEELTEAKLRELERNLRATGLYAEAWASVVPTADPGRVDLLIHTRDRLSLALGAAGSTVGDVGSVQAGISENNLFGHGDRLSLDYRENSEGEFQGGVGYRDRYVFNRWLRFDARAATTEEGEQLRLRIDRPLMHLRDRWSYRLDVASIESEVDYFQGGESVAEVPERSDELGFGFQRAFGPPEARSRLGMTSRYSDRTYGLANGPAASQIEVPGDTRSWLIGPVLGYDRAHRFARETRLDTLGFVQDLRLGYGVELLPGVTWRAEEAQSAGWQPTLGLASNYALQPVAGTYLTATASGLLRQSAGDAVGWNVDTSVHAYGILPYGHTLAGSLTFDQVFESEDLPVELTLGGDNGLRAYPAREFAGDRRVRLNLEERYDTGLRFAEINLGLVGFYDAGWIAAADEGFGDMLHGVGFGLRLGSPTLLGSTVVRIDLAFPLHEPDGADYSPTLSIATSQVFSFFGNQSSLSTR